MTVCTASLFFWNYATAPESDIGPAVVAASDRKLTDSSLGIGYEGSRFKGALLPNKKLVLIAGEMVAHSAIIRSLQTELKDQTLTTTDTADMVGQLVARYRMREAARQYLSPLNLNADTFLGQQRTMEANLVIELSNQLQGHRIDAEAIVVGCDGEKEASLYRIDDRGQVTCHSDIGFVSIGSGGIHSSAYYMTTEYTHANMYYYALYHTFAAKKRAEVDPYVGKYTDLWLVNRNGIFQIPPDITKSLNKFYEDNVEEQKKLPVMAQKVLVEAHKPLWGQNTSVGNLGDSPNTPLMSRGIISAPVQKPPPSTKGGRSRKRPSQAKS